MFGGSGRGRGGAASSCKNVSLDSLFDLMSTIIPGLPNDWSCLCLAFVPFSVHRRMKTVCKAWLTVFTSRALLDIRSEWNKTEEFLCIFADDPSLTHGELFDPRTKQWALIPHMPCDSSTYGLSNFACVEAGKAVFVIGGAFYDARSFPLDRPLASSVVFRYDPFCFRWEKLANMQVPRGSFACGVLDDNIIVAGGSSRHPQFPSGGSHVSAAERYEIKNDRWHFVEGLRRIRAGCAGFLYHGEFWVIGGYGNPRTISNVLPADEYYRDGEIMDFKTGGWRYLPPMWRNGERMRLGDVAVLDAGDKKEGGVFMLDGFKLFRYNFVANHWNYEAEVPKKDFMGVSRLIAFEEELLVISELRSCMIRFQAYHPMKMVWRSISTKPRRHNIINPWSAMCTVRL